VGGGGAIYDVSVFMKSCTKGNNFGPEGKVWAANLIVKMSINILLLLLK